MKFNYVYFGNNKLIHFGFSIFNLGIVESENNICFSLSSQVFMLSRFFKIRFCHICVTFSVNFFVNISHPKYIFLSKKKIVFYTTSFVTCYEN